MVMQLLNTKLLSTKLLSKTLLSKTLFTVLGVSLSVNAVAAADYSHASVNEYEWVVLDRAGANDNSQYFCKIDERRDNYTDYMSCNYQMREMSDNNKAKQWGLEKKVVREQDTIYITLPNRQRPLTFKDEFGHPNEGDATYYELEKYDKDRQLLYLTEYLYESARAAVVNLKTGQWHTFWDSMADTLSVSPDQRYVAGFDSTPGSDGEVLIWQQATKGFAQGYYQRSASDYDQAFNKLRRHLQAYYQANNAYEAREARRITWHDTHSFDVSYFYKINEADTAAFAVRYTFRRDDQSGQWRVFAAKSNSQ